MTQSGEGWGGHLARVRIWCSTGFVGEATGSAGVANVSKSSFAPASLHRGLGVQGWRSRGAGVVEGAGGNIPEPCTITCMIYIYICIRIS